MDEYRVRVTFTRPLLGSSPSEEGIYEEYVKGKSDQASEEEIEHLPEEEFEKGTTVFMRQDDKPALKDYVVAGYLKETCSILRRVPGTLSSKLQAHKKIIDGLVFASPEYIVVEAAGEIEILQRPLRAQTAKGERIALTASEMLPAGSTMEFTLKIIGVVKEPLLREWLDHGELHGFGCWRNAGYGRFSYEMTKL